MKRAVVHGCLVGGIVALAFSAAVRGQQSKSAALAKELAAALDAAKLESIAAKDPSKPDVYVGALYFPGLQLLAVSASYSAPVFLDARLGKREYREVYIDLNSASAPGTKVFIEDLGVDGLKPKRLDDAPFDTYEAVGKRTSFDNEWRRQQMSEEQYLETFAAAEQRYAEMLSLLLAELKKSS